jgi:hypothetical protein
VTAHLPLAFTAAAVTAVILLARWSTTPRKWCRHHVRSLSLPWHHSARDPSKRAVTPTPIPAPQSQAPNSHAQWVVREAEQILSRQWSRLEHLYIHHPGGTEPHGR